MVASPDPRWIQGAFNTLVGLFDIVGLRTNVGKTVSIVFRICKVAVTQLEMVYRIRITGEGPTYQEKHKGRFQSR